MPEVLDYMAEEWGYMQYGGVVLLYGAMILQATQFTMAKMCNKGHVPDHEGEDDYPHFKSILYQSPTPPPDPWYSLHIN